MMEPIVLRRASIFARLALGYDVRMAQRRPARPSRPADAPVTRNLWQTAAPFAALVAVTLLAYMPALQGGLVWDDASHVTAPALQSLHGLWRIWFDLGATQQYYPLLHSAFWIEHRIWGDAVLGYHLTNIVLHALSACLLVLIVKRLSLPGAWLAGFLFALHPVCVEAVAWISEQKSALSGVFCLAAALAYLYFDQSRRKPTYLLALGLFVLSLMSKTVTATLPAVLLVIFWWQRGRLTFRRDVLPLLPWFAIGIPAGLFTAWVEQAPALIGARGSGYALTLWQRLLLAGRVPFFYAWKVVWPSNMMFIYPRWSIGGPWQWLYPLALVVLLAVLAWYATRNRGPLAAFLIFAGNLFPVLGFFNVYPFRYSYVADHFQYLACLGLLVPAACGLTVLAERVGSGALARLAVAAVLVSALGAATWQQSGQYRDYETLFRATLIRNPDSAFLHSNLGVRLMLDPDRVAEAKSEFEAAVRLQPDSAEFHDNLGLALASMPGHLPEAIAEYQTALRLNPDFQPAHLNLGLAWSATPGHLPDAVAEYQKALQAGPELWQVHLNLGIAYSRMPGRQADALAEYRAALRIKPDSSLAHFNLGNTLQTMGRLPDAIGEYRTAISLNPSAVDSRYELAYALAQIPGRVPEAIAECTELLRIHPEDGPGRELMASLQAFQQGRNRRP